jgi:hypothetical protein
MQILTAAVSEDFAIVDIVSLRIVVWQFYAVSQLPTERNGPSHTGLYPEHFTFTAREWICVSPRNKSPARQHASTPAEPETVQELRGSEDTDGVHDIRAPIPAPWDEASNGNEPQQLAERSRLRPATWRRRRRRRRRREV